MSRSPRSSMVPPRNGVSPSCVASPTAHVDAPQWRTLADFLIVRLHQVSAETWRARLNAGEVLYEDGTSVAPDAPYRPGIRLYYYRDVPDEQPVPFEESVLFQDEHLVVADKPHFLPVTPGGRYVQETLLVRLQRRLALPQLAPLHRIDRETAGLVLFAVNPAERGAYHALFSGREMDKTYEAIAPATSTLTWPHIHQSRLVEHPTEFYRMCETDEASTPNSETQLDMLEQKGDWARYQLKPVTGKRHQLRVHMNALGLPILGDQLYPTVLHGPDDVEDFAKPLQLLAKHLRFIDPVTGTLRDFQSARSLEWPP